MSTWVYGYSQGSSFDLLPVFLFRFFEPSSGYEISVQFLPVTGALVEPAGRTPSFMAQLASLTDSAALPASLAQSLNNNGVISLKILAPVSNGTYRLQSADWEALPNVRAFVSDHACSAVSPICTSTERQRFKRNPESRALVAFHTGCSI